MAQLRQPIQPAPAPPAADRDSAHRVGWMTAVLLVCGLAAYATSFQGVFLFDDAAYITETPQIRQAVPLRQLLGIDRPLLVLTLHYNYRLHGLEPLGYHVVNLAIHLTAGLLLFGLLRRTMLRAGLDARRAAWLAWLTALLWTVHPLQTQAVTYVIQRGESMMGMFYLATLYCLVRGADARLPLGRFAWYALTLVCCMLGMASKQVMVTAPLVALLYDRIYLSRSWLEVLRKRGLLHLALFASLALLSSSILSAFRPADAAARPENPIARKPSDPAPAPGLDGPSAGFHTSITPVAYALSQPGVLLHYLRLSVWPHPLCIDYLWPLARTPLAIVPPLLAILALLGGTLWGLVRAPQVAFPALCFFLILAPTSSIMPIVDLAVEHRMYLPLAGVLVLLVLGADRLLDLAAEKSKWNAQTRVKWKGIVAGTVVLLFAALTLMRNTTYHSQAAMWLDVIDQVPTNPRAYNNAGRAYEKAVTALNPDERAEQLKLAEAFYQRACDLYPKLPMYFYNLATLQGSMGKYTEAEVNLRKALQLDPHFWTAHNNLGIVLLARGEVDEAMDHLNKAKAISPQEAEPYTNLGQALLLRGEFEQAEQHYRRAIELRPEAKLHANLGSLLVRSGRPKAAEQEIRRAIAMAPENPKYRYDLAQALYEAGEREAAAQEYRAVLQQVPNIVEGFRSHAWRLATAAQAKMRNPSEAQQLARQACQATEFRDARCLDTLAAAQAANGNFAAAAETARDALARSTDATLSDAIRERLRLYEAGTPYVERAAAGP